MQRGVGRWVWGAEEGRFEALINKMHRIYRKRICQNHAAGRLKHSMTGYSMSDLNSRKIRQPSRGKTFHIKEEPDARSFSHSLHRRKGRSVGVKSVAAKNQEVLLLNSAEL